MSFRTAVLALPIALVLAASFASAQTEPAAATTRSQNVDTLLRESQRENKGLMFFVGGQSIGAVVVEVGAEYITARNREYGTILIRRDRIDAVAGN
jgi:hypothetical protein